MFDNLLTLGVLLGAKAYFTKEPIQLILPIARAKPIFDQLTHYGFYPLTFGHELVRKNKIWSLAKDLGDNYELHVRAISVGNDLFNLSSHVDFGPRHSIRHIVKGILTNKEKSYSLGEKLLRGFLR